MAGEGTKDATDVSDPAPDSASLQPIKLDRSPKVAELVARSLADYIIEHDLEPGDALPNEREMTDWLNVGRGTLREALRLLETQGVVMIRPGPGGGPVVREQQPKDLVSSMTLILQLMRATFDQVIDARVAIEPSIARAAAQRCDPVHVARLRELADAMTAAAHEIHGMRKVYDQYHRALGAATDNEVMMVIVATLQEICSIYEAEVEYQPSRFKATAETHSQLTDAIEAGDADRAEELMADHLAAYQATFNKKHKHLVGQRIRWNW